MCGPYAIVQRQRNSQLSPPSVLLAFWGGTDNLRDQTAQPRPISSPHSDKMEGLRQWRSEEEVRKEGTSLGV